MEIPSVHEHKLFKLFFGSPSPRFHIILDTETFLSSQRNDKNQLKGQLSIIRALL